MFKIAWSTRGRLPFLVDNVPDQILDLLEVWVSEAIEDENRE